MSQQYHTLYHCGCPAPPGILFYIYQRTPATTSPKDNDSADDVSTARRTLQFCCSNACCEAAVRHKQRVYDSLVEDNEELVRDMENVGRGEMARFAAGLETAKVDAEQERRRHESCGEDRRAFVKEPDAAES